MNLCKKAHPVRTALASSTRIRIIVKSNQFSWCKSFANSQRFHKLSIFVDSKNVDPAAGKTGSMLLIAWNQTVVYFLKIIKTSHLVHPLLHSHSAASESVTLHSLASVVHTPVAKVQVAACLIPKSEAVPPVLGFVLGAP